MHRQNWTQWKGNPQGHTGSRTPQQLLPHHRSNPGDGELLEPFNQHGNHRVHSERYLPGGVASLPSQVLGPNARLDASWSHSMAPATPRSRNPSAARSSTTPLFAPKDFDGTPAPTHASPSVNPRLNELGPLLFNKNLVKTVWDFRTEPEAAKLFRVRGIFAGSVTLEDLYLTRPRQLSNQRQLLQLTSPVPNHLLRWSA